MTEPRLYVSHESALAFWRTNPPQYVLEGADRNIRVLRSCPQTDTQVRGFALSEAEFGPFPVDVLVPPDGPRPRSVLRYHVQKAQVPPHSLYPLRDGIHVSSPELCFVQLCRTMQFQEALLLGMELCGTYALRPGEIYGMGKRDYQLTNAARLGRKVEAWGGLRGLLLARRVAPYLADASASPMETMTYLLLCLPQKYGGYHLPKPELNPVMDLTPEARMVLRQERVKPDLLWRTERLIVEYDGDYHTDPAQAAKDEKRRMMLESMEYRVVTLKKHHVFDPVAFDAFARMTAKLLGKRVRPLSLQQEHARDVLRETLATVARPVVLP